MDDALLHLRFNEPDLGVLIFRTEGDCATALQHDAFLNQHAEYWLVREIMLYWKRVLKRIDLTSRSLVTLIDPGSCFVGLLAEIYVAGPHVHADGNSIRILGHSCGHSDNL
ncbi:MAG: hypothetical protein CM1200mP18_18250 [Gammaproteobacteria bacterium]|nr:MAG: hypothetical protein CM1200mP18_18250 [Gammaproteobacteria bacterium]